MVEFIPKPRRRWGVESTRALPSQGPLTTLGDLLTWTHHLHGRASGRSNAQLIYEVNYFRPKTEVGDMYLLFRVS